MAAAEVKALQKHDYMMRFIASDVRVDGRKLGETRPSAITLNPISSADGSALVKLGNTIVVCGIKAEISKPATNSPCHGVIVPNVQLPPLCSGLFKPGPPSEEAQVLSQLVRDMITKSSLLDMTELCIEAGKHCWVLYCDALCCNYDGNVADAAFLAVVAALSDLRLPVATYNSETEVLSVDMKEKIALKLNCVPTPLSFCILDNSVLLADPTLEEEAVSHGALTVISIGSEKTCLVLKHGGRPITQKQLEVCTAKAQHRWVEINPLLTDTSSRS